MTPTFDEFCAITKIPRVGLLATPRFNRMTDCVLEELLGLDLDICDSMIHGYWVDLTSLPILFAPRLREYDKSYTPYRENAFTLCLFAWMLFVGMDGMVDAQVVELMRQVRHDLCDIIPLDFGETINGIGRLAHGEEYMDRVLLCYSRSI